MPSNSPIAGDDDEDAGDDRGDRRRRGRSSTWAIAPSTFRLCRSARDSAHATPMFASAPTSADDDDDRALDLGRVDEPLPGLPRDDAGEHEQHRAVDLRREDLRAAEPERERPARRARREPRRDERQRDRARVGEHVRGVGEQGERAARMPATTSTRHEAEDDRQGERQPAPVGVGRDGVGMPVVVVRVRCHKRVTKSARPLYSQSPRSRVQPKGTGDPHPCLFSATSILSCSRSRCRSSWRVGLPILGLGHGGRHLGAVARDRRVGGAPRGLRDEPEADRRDRRRLDGRTRMAPGPYPPRLRPRGGRGRRPFGRRPRPRRCSRSTSPSRSLLRSADPQGPATT